MGELFVYDQKGIRQEQVVSPPVFGSEIAYVPWTSNQVATTGGLTLATFNLTGDGVTPIYIMGGYDMDVPAGNWSSLRTTVTGSVPFSAGCFFEGIVTNPTATAFRSWRPFNIRIPPFTGSGTFSIFALTSAGTANVYGASGPGNSPGAWAFWGAKPTQNLAGQNSEVFKSIGLGASMAQYSSPFGPCEYLKNTSGLVCVRGLITATGTIGAGAVIATIPAGYRPARTLIWIADKSGGTAELRLDSSGQFFLQSVGLNSGDWVSLSCCTYMAEV